MFHEISSRAVSIEFQVVLQRGSLKIQFEPTDNPRAMRKIALEYAFDEFVFVFAVDQFEVELGVEHIFDVGFSGSGKLRESKNLALLQQCLFTKILDRLLVLLL